MQGRREGKTKAENAAHGRAQNLRRKKIGTLPTKKDSIESGSICGTDDGAHVAGVLHAIKRKQAWAVSRFCLQIHYRCNALGCLCIGDTAEDMLGKNECWNSGREIETDAKILPQKDGFHHHAGSKRFTDHFGSLHQESMMHFAAFFVF